MGKISRQKMQVRRYAALCRHDAEDLRKRLARVRHWLSRPTGIATSFGLGVAIPYLARRSHPALAWFARGFFLLFQIASHSPEQKEIPAGESLAHE